MFRFAKFGGNQYTLLNSSLSLSLGCPVKFCKVFDEKILEEFYSRVNTLLFLRKKASTKNVFKLLTRNRKKLLRGRPGLVQKNFKHLINSNIFCATKNLNANITPAAGARCRPKQTGSSTLLITHNKGKHILFCICNSCWLNCKYQQPKNISSKFTRTIVCQFFYSKDRNWSRPFEAAPAPQHRKWKEILLNN